MRKIPAVISLKTALLIAIFLCELTYAAPTHVENDGPSSPLSFSAFVDGTYAYDVNDLPTHTRPYTTQPYYADELALNLGYVDTTLHAGDYHGRLALQYGSSVIANYAEEPDRFVRYFQEAFLGTEVLDGLTIDAGIYFSHIGMERWISRDNINVGRSLIAENSPYYQSGIRIAYELRPSVKTELHLLRGWQNISDNAKPALGTLLAYSPSPRLILQHSTFVGDVSGGRFFNHIGVGVDLTRRIKVIAGYDLGFQERRDDTTAIWHGWAVSSRYRASDPIALGMRIERYSDPSEVIVKSLSESSFTTIGLSWNVDYALTKKLIWRNEYRVFLGSSDLFPSAGHFDSSDAIITSSLLYTLDSQA